MIQITEKYIQGKISPEACEDALFLSDHFVVVIDGVTPKSAFTYRGKTTGKLAAEIVTEAFRYMNPTADLDEILRCLCLEFQKFYETVPFPYSRREKGLQAACVIYSDYHREIWMIGDCQASVDGEVYLNGKKSDEILSSMRSLILHILQAEQCPADQAPATARREILPWILRSTLFANRDDSDFGYSVLNGEEIPPSLIRRIPLSREPHNIILTSDGYPAVCNTLEESEAYLQKVMREDPECANFYLSTKGLQPGQVSFDDRTYVRFSI